MRAFDDSVRLPVLTEGAMDWSSDADFPVLIQTRWPALHTVFRPDGKIGTCIYQLQVKEKYEIVVRNWLGLGTTRKRNFSYLDYADQEIKIEVIGHKNGFNNVPYKLRINDRTSDKNQNITWDSDHPQEHKNCWKFGFKGYVPFSENRNVFVIFQRLNEFAADAVTLMRMGRMPDFSDINDLTSLNFASPPKDPTIGSHQPLLES